jgi:hypothetical protein
MDKAQSLLNREAALPGQSAQNRQSTMAGYEEVNFADIAFELNKRDGAYTGRKYKTRVQFQSTNEYGVSVKGLGDDKSYSLTLKPLVRPPNLEWGEEITVYFTVNDYSPWPTLDKFEKAAPEAPAAPVPARGNEEVNFGDIAFELKKNDNSDGAYTGRKYKVRVQFIRLTDNCVKISGLGDDDSYSLDLKPAVRPPNLETGEEITVYFTVNGDIYGDSPTLDKIEKAAPEAPAAPVTADGAVCAGCGTALGDAKFCPACGTPASAPQTAAFCPNCGTKAEGGVKFCANCGTKLG